VNKRIDENIIINILNRVQKPGRYSGGEYGSGRYFNSRALNIVISYPDLYEIGMSNLSVKILYNLYNSFKNVACERVFAPAPDFEEELRKNNIPLFSLESRIPLSEFDIIGFSVGYELNFTNILAILELGGIPPVTSERSDNDPVVILGGPALINPVPYGSFADCVFMGEAEGWSTEMIPALAELKSAGANRREILYALRLSPYIWFKEKGENTKREIWNGFGKGAVLPSLVSNISTVQDHGVVEIMRGCPHNCRFCSASSFYRPYREIDFKDVIEQIDYQILQCGYREVTLSSLSTGDYHGVFELIQLLNERYLNLGVSFSLPSLRINTFTLDLLSEVSAVRRSGLTFAVETPRAEWQAGVNKIVSLDKTIEVLRKAKKLGWRNAKFYFMIGLPFSDKNKRNADESEYITEFINHIYKEVHMDLNVNVSTFIPKAQTPFQWASQLDETKAMELIHNIKREVISKRIKIRYHSTFLSFLEGIISRGGDRAGWLFYEAFKAGARLDAWDDFINKELWFKIIKDAHWKVREETCREREKNEILPWDKIKIGVSKSYLFREYEKSKKGVMTPDCAEECSVPCGVCNKKIGVKPGSSEKRNISPLSLPMDNVSLVLISFKKTERAKYLSHLDLMTIFDRSFLRAGFFPVLSEGFNPKAKMEFASPLSLGISSFEEIMSAKLFNYTGRDNFMEKINRVLPQGLAVTDVKPLKETGTRKKRKSLMSLFWGSVFRIICGTKKKQKIFMKFKGKQSDYSSIISLAEEEQGFTVKLKQQEKGNKNIIKLFGEITGSEPFCNEISITRIITLAKDPDKNPVPYFELFASSSDFT